MRSALIHYRLALLIGAAAVLAIAAAFVLQYAGGLQPCHLCILERWPYVAAAAIAFIGAAASKPRLALVLVAVAMATGTLLAAYHVGVEEGLFTLPASCIAGQEAQTIDDLRAQLMTAAPTCDQVKAVWLGLSLASWNALLALGLTLLALIGALKTS
ncbi:disulfide bond formation protein DsbB [Arboricoccus pini]|uniref:Disulfide bond formation protein DsbB n=1 Tax=Arboricoccus pini TaxID=1963835 RepID=A0A212QRV0_9PROT|nr:disulfide bond formation protein B [Arboricoccus pini]SNB62176.1 disulfide bond formation protein DsbB [Arboricoccus pini]